MILQYRSGAMVDALQLGECVMRPCSGGQNGARFWHLWFHVSRIDGQPDTFAVPMAPNGSYDANGPGGKTWGLTKTAPGTWQVSPSINVLDTREPHPGPNADAGSLWHETPVIVAVPDTEPWTKGGAP